MKNIKLLLLLFSIATCGLLSLSLITLSLMGRIDLFYGMISASGWLISTVLIMVGYWQFTKLEIQYLIEKRNIYYEANAKLEEATIAIKRAYGYRGDLDDSFSIYSKMLGSGIRVPTANALFTFAENLKRSDSIFLIKVDNETNEWSFHVAGNPIHINVAEWVLNIVSEKCKEGASHDCLIWESKKIVN